MDCPPAMAAMRRFDKKAVSPQKGNAETARRLSAVVCRLSLIGLIAYLGLACRMMPHLQSPSVFLFLASAGICRLYNHIPRVPRISCSHQRANSCVPHVAYMFSIRYEVIPMLNTRVSCRIFPQMTQLGNLPLQRRLPSCPIDQP